MSSDSSLINDVPLVVNEVSDERPVGAYIGNVKWFSDRLGYGFVTIQNGAHKGNDVFLHHSSIHPLNSVYKSLSKGEYVALDIVDGTNGKQCANVTGVLGGPLKCDAVTTAPRPYAPYPHTGPPAPPTTPSPQGVIYHSTAPYAGRGTPRVPAGRGAPYAGRGRGAPDAGGRGRGRGRYVQSSFGEGF